MKIEFEDKELQALIETGKSKKYKKISKNRLQMAMLKDSFSQNMMEV